MNGPFQVAQLSSPGNSGNNPPVRIYKLTKPLTDQAVVVNVGYDQKVKIDFTAIANEKITLVHVGEKLIILFDNDSTVTVEPFFKSRADGLQGESRNEIIVEMAPGRDVSVKEFATLFPITTDASVLPAADQSGTTGNAQASGANFSPFSIDPLFPPPLNPLAGPEELGNFVIEVPIVVTLPEEPVIPTTPTPPVGPTITLGSLPDLVVDESFLTVATNGVAGSGQAPLGATVATGLLPVTVSAPAGQQSLVFALSITDATTNLIDTASGQAVTLVQKGSGEVDGVVTINGNETIVFTLTVDATGHLTLKDLRAVHENTPGDSNENILVGAVGHVLLTATVTDVNGNSASASVDVGPHLQILDDGPTASIGLVAQASVTLDESIGDRPANSGGAADGNDTSDDIAAVNPDPFGGVYGTPIGAAADVALVTAGSIAGADGGSQQVTLAIVGGSGSDSGLKTTDGTQIDLYLEANGDVTGRVGGANGTVIFAVRLDNNGDLTVAQYDSLEHGTSPDNFDEQLTLAGHLNAVVTVTDGDNDVATQSIDIGNAIQFQDDGPTASISRVSEGREGPVTSVTLDESVGDRPANSAGTPDFNDTSDDITAGNPDPFGGAYGAPIGARADVALVTTAGSSFGSDDEGASQQVALEIVGGSGSDSGLKTTDGTQIDLYLEANGDVTGRVGGANGTVIFAVRIDNNGELTVAQYDSLEHGTFPDNYDEQLTLAGHLNAVVTVTDGDLDVATDTVAIGDGIRFEDDGPTASIDLVAQASVTLDESVGDRPANSAGTPDFNDTSDDITAGNPDPFGGAYGAPIGARADVALVTTAGSSFGSDDEGASQQVTLEIVGGSGSDSGLKTTDGTQIDLYLEANGDVTGRVGGANGTVIFAVRIDNNGELTVAQYDSLEHGTFPDNYDEQLTLAGHLNAVVTVTDGDQDAATDKVAIGDAIQFQDDGPTAGIVATGNSVVMDESIGDRPATSAGAADGNDTTDDINVGNPDPFAGAYGAPIGALANVDLVDTTTSAGSDDEGASQQVTLAIVGGSGSDSGLKTTDGTQIDLYLEANGDVTGRVGGANGTVIFAVRIDNNGELTVAQYDSLEHGTFPDNYDEQLTLAGHLNAVVTVTDGDNDVTSQSIGIGNAIQFQDDGPTASIVATGNSVVMDESVGDRPADSAGAADGNDTTDDITGGNPDPFGGVYGAPIGALANVDLVDTTTSAGSDDEGATTTLTLEIVGGSGSDSGLKTTDGTQIDLYLEANGDVTGRVGGANGTVIFAVRIDNNGELTVAQYDSLEHGTFPDNYDEQLTLAGHLNAVVTVTDGDSDVATQSIDIGNAIQFQDDGPTASIDLLARVSVTLDESVGDRPADSAGAADGNDTTDDITGGNPDPFGGVYGTPIGALADVALVTTAGSSVGSDDEGASQQVALEIVGGSGSDSGLKTTDGTQIDLYLEANGDVTGRVGGANGTVIFAVRIDNNGELTVAQYDSLEHGTFPDNYDEQLTLAGHLNAVVTVTDGDQDAATDKVAIGDAIQFQDDGPTAGIVATGNSVVMDESIGDRPANSTGTADANDTSDDNVAGNPFSAAYGTPIGLLSNVDLVNTTTTTGSDNEGATTTVTLSIVGGNGTDSGLQTTDNRQISLFNEGGVIVGRMDNPDGTFNAAGTVAFAISINANGEVTTAQYLSLEHGTFPDNYDESLNLSGLLNAVVTVTDGDNDVATQSIGIGNAIQFQDDGPTAGIVATGNSVVMDESIGDRPANSIGTADANDTSDDNVAGNPFSAAYGTPIGLLSNVDLVNTTTTTGSDNEGATTTVTLSIVGGNGTDSGLQTTDNRQISLFNEGGVIVGRMDNPDGTFNAAGTVAFAISINANGEVTTAQYLSLEHGTFPDNYDESLNLSGLLNAVVTVTDGDNDVATQSIGIGNAIQFQDDGPTAGIVATGNSVVMDESIGDRPANSTGTADANDTSDDNVAGNPFSAAYGTPIGLLSNVDLVNTTTTTGSDNEGATTTVTLSIVGGNGTDSGLQTTDNRQISLFNEGGVIVGRMDNPDGTFNAAGTVAFAISINANGEVTTAQYLSLEHGTFPDNYDESLNLSGLLNAVVTVTDGDNDVATQSIGIGNAIQFQDDGPTAGIVATGNSVVMDESIGDRPANSTGTADANDTSDDNVAGNPFSAAYGTPIGLLSNVDLVNTTTTTGSDNEGATTTVTLSIVGGNGTDSGLQTTDNRQISLFNEGGVIVGRMDNPDGTFNAAGTVAFAISINANGEVTTAQYLSLEHGTFPDNYDESLNLSGLLNAVVTVTDGDNDVATQSIGIGNAIQFQDDGPTAGIVATGNSVVMDESIGDRPANSTGTADANDTSDDNVAGNPFSAAYGTPIGLLSNVDLVNTTTTTGSDNEGATTTVTLSIVGGNGTDSGLQTTDNRQISLFNEGGVIVGRMDNPDGTFNAAGTVAFAISINANGEVTTAQYLSLEHGTFPDNYDESLNLSGLLNAVVTVTDGDNDVATQSIGIGNAIQFQDDGPTAGIVATGNSVVMDESIGDRPANSTGTADANDTSDDNVAGNPFSAAYGTPIGLLSNVDLVNTTTTTGSDNEGATTTVTLSIVGGNGTDSGLQTTDNRQISLFNEGGVIVGRMDNPDGTFNAAGTVAFAISINANGEVTTAQYLSLEHGTFPDNYDESLNLSGLLNAVVTVTDGDNDVATQSIGIGNAIQFQDDGPTATIVQGAPIVAHDETAGLQGDADDTTAPAVAALFAGVANISTDLSPTGYAQDLGAVVSSTGSSYGSDQEGGTTVFSLSVSAVGVDSGLDTTNGTGIFLFKEGDLVVGRIGGAAGAAAFAVSIDGTTGVVSIAQYASLRHPDGTNPDESVSITDGVLLATVTVTDGDGDKATASTGIGDAIQFQDDGPVINNVQDAIVANTSGVVVGAIDVNYGVDDSNSTTAATVQVTTDAGVRTTNSGLVITGWDDLDGITETLSADGKTLTATVDATGAQFYQLVVNDATNTYSLTHTARPVVEIPLNFAAASGGPGAETLSVPAGDFTVVFNGGIAVGGVLTDLGEGQPGDDDDDVKPTGNGFGIGDSTGQTTIENNEGFFVNIFDQATPVTVDAISFEIDRTGGNNNPTTMHVHWQAYDALGNPIVGGAGFNAGSGDQVIVIPKEPANGFVTINPPGEFETIAVWFTDQVGGGNVRIENFTITTTVIPQDQPLHFDIAAVDGDGDISATSGLDVVLQGGAGPDFTLTGTAQSEVLAGGAGADTLIGGLGNDTLSGAGGADHFRYNATGEGLDNILDFTSGSDVLDFKSSAFGNLAIGTLTNANFESNATGVSTLGGPEFVYNTTSKVLSYDADGAGAAQAIAMAHLENGVPLAAANIHIVA